MTWVYQTARGFRGDVFQLDDSIGSIGRALVFGMMDTRQIYPEARIDALFDFCEVITNEYRRRQSKNRS